MLKRGILLLLVVILLIPLVLGNDHEERIDKTIKEWQLPILYVAMFIVTLLVIATFKFKEKLKNDKKAIFITLLIVISISTLYLAGSTIYINSISDTKGPVHWHADFEFWNCGEKIDLKNPTGLSNRIGTPVYHEHGDDRIHVEGTVVETNDVNLKEFFKVTGGNLDSDSYSILTDDGLIKVENGEQCGNKVGEVQVFVYQVVNARPTQKDNYIYRQIKLSNHEDYVLSPYINVPPGDCIIVEFDEEKDSTDKMCETFKIQLEKGELTKEDGG